MSKNKLFSLFYCLYLITWYNIKKFKTNNLYSL